MASGHGSADEAAVRIDELTTDDCWRLLAEAVVGRLCFVTDGEPAVLPVNHLVNDLSIVIRTAPSGSLERLSGGATVAFEVDDLDRASETGWSVVVRGYIAEIVDPAELAIAATLPLHAWASGLRDHWLRIRPWAVTGRSIRRRD